MMAPTQATETGFDVRRLSTVGRELWRRYGSEAKLTNARKLHAAATGGAQTVEAYPWRIVLEPGNICNLRCCTGRARTEPLARGFLQRADAERFLDELWPHLVQVNLFNWGEPLLNRELPEIIASIHGRGVGTQIHSNLNHLPDGLAERLVESGLDFLVGSIDGATQDTYATYRRGGSCERALANLRRMVEVRRALGRQTPRIVWRFLCFPHTCTRYQRPAGWLRNWRWTIWPLAKGRWTGRSTTSMASRAPARWMRSSRPTARTCTTFRSSISTVRCCPAAWSASSGSRGAT